MTRHSLSKKDKKRLSPLFLEMLGIEPETLRKLDVQVEKQQGFYVYYVDGEPALIVEDTGLAFPFLKYLIKKRIRPSGLPRVYVDEGAVVPLGKGADLMAPGVVKIEGDFGEGSIALVIGPQELAIAIMRMLVDSNKLRITRKGKVGKNIHHVGDKFWKSI